MPSIIGQMAQGAGPTLSALGSSVGSFFGGGPLATPPPVLPTPTTPPPSDYTSSYFGGGVPGGPTGYTSPGTVGAPGGTFTSDPSLAGAYASGLGPVAAPGAAPGEAALSSLGTDITDPTTSQPLGASLGQTQVPLVQQVLSALGIDPSPAAGGAAGGAGGGGAAKGMGLGGWINMGGNMFELINRYLLQRQLQDPKALAQAANTMAKQMNAKVRAQLVAPTTAAMEESSGVNAPMIYGQAITNALAPGLWEAQQNALREEIQALIASGQAYPQMAASLVPPSTYGGTQ